MNPVKKGRWIFKPSKKKLRLNVELKHPGLVLTERAQYGEDAKLIEIQKLFKDGNIEDAVEAGFARAARLIKTLHANTDGTFPPEVMIYGETTTDLVPLYRDKYNFDILTETTQGTWIMRIKPEVLHEKYATKDFSPKFRVEDKTAGCGRHFIRALFR